MTRTVTITYDRSNEDIPVMCVAESNLFSTTIINVFTGERAEQLYKELIGHNVTIKVGSEEQYESH